MNHNPFDRELDQSSYEEYEAQRRAWDRARAAFVVAAFGFVVLVTIVGCAWFGAKSEVAITGLAFAASVAIAVAWKYFERSCTVRLNELDRLGMERARQQRRARSEVTRG